MQLVIVSSKPSVLVVVMGLSRGGPLAYQSLLTHLVAPLQADLALLIPHHSRDSYLRRHAKYIWSFTEPESWMEVLESAAENCVNPSDEWVSKLCKNATRQSFAMKGVVGCGEDFGANGIVLGMQWMLQRKLFKSKVYLKYDWFIITRSDLLYLCDHPQIITLNEDVISIPEPMPFEDLFSKYSDKHLVVSRRHVLAALNTTSQMLCDVDGFLAGYPSHRGVNAPPTPEAGCDTETAMAVAWHASGLRVEVFKRVMLTVMRDNDHSRWMGPVKGVIDDKYGIALKHPYEEEMVQAQRNCKVSVNEYLEAWSRYPYPR